MKKSSLLKLSMAFILSLSLVGCGSSGTPAKETTSAPGTDAQKEGVQPIELKLGTVFPPNEPVNVVAEQVAQRVKERTNGKVIIKVFPASQLGGDKDRIEQVRSGAPIITVFDAGFVQDFVPDYGILGGPFLVNNYNDYVKLLESDWYKSTEKKLNDFNLQSLSFNWYFGERDIISSKAIKSPEDMKGMKVRIPPNPMWKATVAAMGGTPTVLEWSEVYTGLTSGVVDAAEAPLSTIYGSKLHESAKTLSMTGHFKQLLGFAMNTQIFNDLPKDVQQILLEEFSKGGTELSQKTEQSFNEWKEKFKSEGVTVVDDVDVEAFRKATEGVYKEFPKWTPGLYDQVQEILKK